MDGPMDSPTNKRTYPVIEMQKVDFWAKNVRYFKKNVAQVLRITFKTMDNPIDGPTSRPSNGHTLM